MSDAALSAGTVQTRTAARIATVEFAHPKGNSLPSALLVELARAIRTAGADPAARVIVLRSTGSSTFCAGASFDEFLAVATAEEGQRFFSGFSQVIRAMVEAPKFVLTRVQGQAAGGALGLIAASDYSIAVRSARAKLSELQVGIGPFVVGVVIERKLGLARFMNLGVHADWHDAEWCERHGLYSMLVDDEAALDAAVAAHATRLAAANPEAMREMKRIFWRGTEGWEAEMSQRAAMSGRMVLSEFTKDALAKFRSRIALALIALSAVACGGGPSEPAPDPTAAQVSVTPATLTLASGATGQLTATPRDGAGAALTGRKVTWTSQDTTIAKVDAAGLVTAQLVRAATAGETRITASVDGKSATASVTVSPVPVARVVVTPTPLTLTIGETRQLTATLTDAAGVTLTGRTITWLSGDSTKVRVSSTGVVTAVAAGTSSVGAISEGQLGTASVSVAAPSTSLTLRDSLVTATQGLFMGAASRDLSRIAVGPNVDGTSTTRELLFTDFTGTVLARHDVGGATWAVAMTPDGARTVVGSDDEQVYVFQGTALRNRGRPLTGNTQVRGVAISDDGRWAGTGGQRFVLLDLDAASPLDPVFVDSTLTQTRAMDFASGGRWLAYGGRQEISGRQLSIVAVYDLTSRTRVLWDTIPTTAENGELRSLAISSDGNRIIAGDWAGRLHYYVRTNPASTTWTRSTQDVASRIYWVDLTADASRAVVGTQGSDLRLYDLSSTAATLAWKRPATGVPLNPPMDGGQRTVHITPDGKSISAGTRGGGSGGGQIFVFDANGNVRLGRASFATQVAGAWKARAGAADPEVWFVRVSDDGTRAVMASYGGILYFFTGNAP